MRYTNEARAYAYALNMWMNLIKFNFMHQSIFIGQYNAANDRNRCTIQPSYGIWINVSSFIESQMSTVSNLNVQSIRMFSCKWIDNSEQQY